VVLLWIGLWTPFAAVVATVIQVATISLARRIDPSLAVAAALGLSLAMLGPVGLGRTVVWPQANRLIRRH
jgi:hypothetical protein